MKTSYINNIIFKILQLLLFFPLNIKAQNFEHINHLIYQGKYHEAIKYIEEEEKKNYNNSQLNLQKAEIYLYLNENNKDTSDIIINKAFESILKAYIDNNKSDKISELAKRCYNITYRKAGINLNLENYKLANEWFIKVKKLSEIIKLNDSYVNYYAGLSAFNSEDYNFMLQCFDNYNVPSEYKKETAEMLIIYYNNANEINKMLEILNYINYNSIEINEEIMISTLKQLLKNGRCNEKIVNNLSNQYENKNVQLEIARYFYFCKDTATSIDILTKTYKKFPDDTLISSQLALIHYNNAIYYLKLAKELINKDENNIERYRKLKDKYIEEMKLSVFYNENAIKNNLKSTENIICLYDSYKHLQRKEEMVKLKLKYNFLK